MKKTLIILFLTLLAVSGLYAQTPAFPGAEGGGMYATGGRGGTVYYVNTLEDSNTGSAINKVGSLRWCLNQKGKRTIVFNVNGTIRLNSKLSIKNGDVTIAGQSAPGDGICLADYPMEIGADNVVIRYMRFRMGDDKLTSDEAEGADALGGRFFKNVIIDHCSVSWSTDECVSFYNCNYFTLQWCIISESLRISKHNKGAHGFGGIWGGTNTTFHHNLMAHHDSRTPRFGPGRDILPHVETVDHRNNVNYNHGNTYGGEGMNINIMNNFYKPGAGSSTGTARGRIISFDKDKNEGSIRYDVWGQLYVDGNVVDDGKNEANCVRATNDNWTYGVFNQFHSSYGTVSAEDKAAMKMEKPFDIKGLSDNVEVLSSVTTHPARKAFEKVLDYAGMSLKRDSYDKRIVNETRTGTTTYKGLNPGNTGRYPKAGIIDSHWDIKPANAGDDWTPWPVLAQGEAPADTDKDGIPDGWLEANYPGKKATDLNEEGYTYLEVYLNGIVAEITQKQNEDAITGIETEKINGRDGLKVYYDQVSKELHIQVDDMIGSVDLYGVTGALIDSQKCDDNAQTMRIPDNAQRFLILKVTMKNKAILTAKVII